MGPQSQEKPTQNLVISMEGECLLDEDMPTFLELGKDLYNLAGVI